MANVTQLLSTGLTTQLSRFSVFVRLTDWCLTLLPKRQNLRRRDEIWLCCVSFNSGGGKGEKRLMKTVLQLCVQWSSLPHHLYHHEQIIVLWETPNAHKNQLQIHLSSCQSMLLHKRSPHGLSYCRHIHRNFLEKLPRNQVIQAAAITKTARKILEGPMWTTVGLIKQSMEPTCRNCLTHVPPNV